MIGKARVILMVQARMGSSRLPGKVMLKVSGRPILAYQLQRLAQCAMCDDIVVITSTLREDDVIHKFCETLGFRCFKGHPVDLLDRHYRAAQAFAADVIIKIPSDCPLVDPELVDQVISTHIASEADYTSNYHPATFADGFDVEVINFKALEQAFLRATKDWEREHTTPFIWERASEFKLVNVLNAEGNHFLDYRLTLDYAEDFVLLSRLINECSETDLRSYSSIIRYLNDHPEVRAINEKYLGVNWYRNVGDELTTVDSSQWRTYDN